MWKPQEDFVVRLSDESGEERSEAELKEMASQISEIANNFGFDLFQFGGWEGIKRTAIGETKIFKIDEPTTFEVKNHDLKVSLPPGTYSTDARLKPVVEDYPEGWQVSTEESRAVYGDRKERMALNRNILIPSNTILDAAPCGLQLIEDHFELLIEIGNDHTARLLISRSALRALNNLEPKTVIS